jgi:hypothetical protein
MRSDVLLNIPVLLRRGRLELLLLVGVEILHI